MQPNFENLDDDSMLLMYLADELPASRRSDLESRLANDGVLRERLERQRVAHDMLDRSLAELDQAEPLPAGAAMDRHLSAMMAQWQADRLRRSQADQSVTLRQPRRAWAVPAGVAAALFIGFILWWDIQLMKAPTIDPPQIAGMNESSEAIDPDVVAVEADQQEWANGRELADADQQLEMVVLLRNMNTNE